MGVKRCFGMWCRGYCVIEEVMIWYGVVFWNFLGGFDVVLLLVDILCCFFFIVKLGDGKEEGKG